MTSLQRLVTRRVALAAGALALAGISAAAVVTVGSASTPPASAKLTVAQKATKPRASRPLQLAATLRAALVQATVKETGLSLATVRADLRSGKSLDEIAGSKATTVVNDVLAKVQARLQKAVTAGRLTTTAEANELAKVKARLEALMSRQFTKHPRTRPSPSSAISSTNA
jgi:hypothetical protein